MKVKFINESINLYLTLNEIYESLAPYETVQRRNSAGRTGFKQINQAINHVKKRLRLIKKESAKIMTRFTDPSFSLNDATYIKNKNL